MAANNLFGNETPAQAATRQANAANAANKKGYQQQQSQLQMPNSGFAAPSQQSYGGYITGGEGFVPGQLTTTRQYAESQPGYTQIWNPTGAGYDAGAAKTAWDTSQQGRSAAMVDYWQQRPDERLQNDLFPARAQAQNLRAGMDMLSGGAGGAGGAGGVGAFTGGGGTSAASYSGGAPAGGGGGYAPALSTPDNSAANAARFGQAKDQVGQTSRASLQSLRDELGATGMLGSGAEVQGVRDIAQAGQGQLGQVSRDQAVQDSNQTADFAKTRYQGDITQRGQDVQARGDQARIDLQRQLAQQQLLQSALAGLAQAY